MENELDEEDINQESLINDIVLMEHELELLHISRQDNPYLQLLTSSQDNLDRDAGEKTDTSSAFSPEPPYSPGNRSSCGGGGMIIHVICMQVHMHTHT